MSITRSTLEKYLNELLSSDDFKDYGPNGLQVQGKDDITTIAFAVSATKESINKAIELKSDALIVHHGIFWRYQGPKTITGPFYKRVKPLVSHDMNLFAYHLPLDAHIKVGNAATVANKIGLTELKPFGEHKRMPLGVMGVFKKPISQKDLSQKLQEALNHDIIISSHDENKMIKSMGIITGGANNEWSFALEEGLDSYLTGEISEYNWHDAKEAEIVYFAGGHHATEKFGVQALAEEILKNFPNQNIKVHFIDSENPA